MHASMHVCVSQSHCVSINQVVAARFSSNVVANIANMDGSLKELTMAGISSFNCRQFCYKSHEANNPSNRHTLDS